MYIILIRYEMGGFIMNKKSIINSVMSNMNIKNESKEIIDDINKAKKEWQIANEYFNLVHDPDLVDYAIYTLDAAKKKYVYLLSQAKKRGISADYCSTLKVANRD